MQSQAPTAGVASSIQPLQQHEMVLQDVEDDLQVLTPLEEALVLQPYGQTGTTQHPQAAVFQQQAQPITPREVRPATVSVRHVQLCNAMHATILYQINSRAMLLFVVHASSVTSNAEAAGLLQDMPLHPNDASLFFNSEH